MFKSYITPALIALTLGSTAAFAASPSSDAQLAASAGVAAGEYSAAELQSIINARLENNQSALNYYLSGANRSAADRNGDAAGQLAKLAGVQEGAYSASELALIKAAKVANDETSVNYYVSGTNRVAPAGADVVTPGKAQLAAALGLNPADYTLSQLTQLTVAAQD